MFSDGTVAEYCLSVEEPYTYWQLCVSLIQPRYALRTWQCTRMGMSDMKQTLPGTDATAGWLDEFRDRH